MTEVSIQQHLTVLAEHHGQRIDIVLAKLFSSYSRSQLSAWLKEGYITVNHHPCKPKDKVMHGDEIDINIDLTSKSHLASSSPEAIPLTIVFEDEDLLIINKPAGLVVHPGAGNPNHTLVNALLYYLETLYYLPRAGIIHRLDKDTTGLLLVAKTISAYTYLIKQMQDRNIQRYYVALVHGHLVSGGEVNTFYGRHPRNRLKMAVRDQGRQAITHFSIRKHYPDFTLLDINLLTGRTHQIRVHMAHLHHPIVGDSLYGGIKRFPSKKNNSLQQMLLHFRRQALHAAQLSFIHPRLEKKMSFEAELPHDFQLLIKALDDSSE